MNSAIDATQDYVNAREWSGYVYPETLAKCCTKCAKSKRLDNFYRKRGGRHGRHSICKACVSAERQAERKREAEAKRSYEKWHPELLFAKVVDRFWAKVVWNGGEDECWTWEASKTHDGYGKFWDSSRSRLTPAHRFAYELLVGPVPDGLHLDHLCRTRHCVNPTHLEPVTQRENLLRGDTIQARNAAKTHCVHGHPLSGDNLYVDARGCRSCWACKRAAAKRYREEAKAAT